jgi:hypothetical protein
MEKAEDILGREPQLTQCYYRYNAKYYKETD